MITIWKMTGDAWELVEELQGDLVQRLAELRADGNEYRAEKRDDFGATILEV
jgi:hypothetical protein